MTARGSSTGGSGGAKPAGNEQFNQAADQAQQKLGEAKGKAGEIKDQASSKAADVKDQATEKSDQGLEQASHGMSQAADKLREQSEGDGPLPPQAAMVADKLDQASSYLQSKDTNEIVSDLEAFVRSKPLESVAGAVAIGFVLAKIIR